jgi:L-cystine uptake protein TcyP (sodium:dicarboxylate symporter family)
MESPTVSDFIIALVIFGAVAGATAIRLERDPRTESRRFALRLEEANIWISAAAALLPLLLKQVRGA